MNIAIFNYLGNTGKTTIARHLLAPRMNDAQIISFESTNLDGKEQIVMRGIEYGKLGEDLVLAEHFIVDIGASNIEDFTNRMQEYQGSHEDFDLFLVPVTRGYKEQIITIKFINMLSKLGIPAEKINLVFNRVEESAENEFSQLFNYAKKENKCIANSDTAIYENELFDMAAVKNFTITEILNDANDYKAMLRELGKDGDKKLFSHYADMHWMKAAAKSVNRNLDDVFAAITGTSINKQN